MYPVSIIPLRYECPIPIHNLGDIMDGFLIYNIPRIMDRIILCVQSIIPWIMHGIIDGSLIYNIPQIIDCALCNL